MSSSLLDMPSPVAPTAADVRAAKDASQRLSHLLRGRTRGAKPPRLSISASGEKAGRERIELPPAAIQLLLRILADMAAGHAVMLIPVHAELTTQQAADLLGVSRPFIVRQVENGALKYRKVGTHRRILVQDLLDYKRAMDAGRMKALDELTAEAQRLGLGY
ncbi:MAG: helix-turn-helix domain-containing protein [Phycisphaerales bacterium]